MLHTLPSVAKERSPNKMPMRSSSYTSSTGSPVVRTSFPIMSCQSVLDQETLAVYDNRRRGCLFCQAVPPWRKCSNMLHHHPTIIGNSFSNHSWVAFALPWLRLRGYLTCSISCMQVMVFEGPLCRATPSISLLSELGIHIKENYHLVNAVEPWLDSKLVGLFKIHRSDIDFFIRLYCFVSFPVAYLSPLFKDTWNRLSSGKISKVSNAEPEIIFNGPGARNDDG